MRSRIKNKEFRIIICLFLFALLPNAFCSIDGNSVTVLPAKIVLFPIKRAEISSLVDSSVKEYNFKEGEDFKKNDVLVKLDREKYQQFYNIAEAELLESKVSSEYIKKSCKQNEELYEEGGLSRQELEKSKLELAVSESNYGQAKASLLIAKNKLDACEIEAPFSGKLVKKIVDKHEFVKETQPIMEIVDDTQLLAVIYFPSMKMKSMKKGKELNFIIDETGSKHVGKVYEIAGEIDPGSRTFKLKAIIDNDNKVLAPGMSGVLVEAKG